MAGSRNLFGGGRGLQGSLVEAFRYLAENKIRRFGDIPCETNSGYQGDDKKETNIDDCLMSGDFTIFPVLDGRFHTERNRVF